jgi:hypothetical protein
LVLNNGFGRALGEADASQGRTHYSVDHDVLSILLFVSVGKTERKFMR